MSADQDVTTRVVLVDDQELVRAGLAMVIDSQPDLAVTGQVGNGTEAVALLRDLACDIVLMDVRMPGMDGVEATRQILAEADAAQRSAPRIVMLTTYDLDEYLLAAIQAGASGFLLKNSRPDSLLAAIRTVRSGDSVIAPSATRRLIEHLTAARTLSAAPDPLVADLTEREREVLLLLARGGSNQEISAQLYLSETTVKTHVRHILAKLGIRDRVQAVVYAYESGLVRPGD
ncbi:MAG: response regulator transcription factor [Micrococcales bacterium]|nr:response regulator transcription factor [Micrococcales bacterium]